MLVKYSLSFIWTPGSGRNFSHSVNQLRGQEGQQPGTSALQYPMAIMDGFGIPHTLSA